MIVIGLTGSVGMGKTTVANMMRERGIPIHDADAAVHELLAAGGAAVPDVAAAFAEAVAQDENGKDYIDRAALGRIVFADHSKKKLLEDILHPMVRAQSDTFKDDMKKRGHDVIALDIPLLFETGGESRVDVTVCVSATQEVQKARVLDRPGMTATKFHRVVAGQMPDAEKRERADYVIENSGDLEDTRAQLDDILTQIHARVPVAAGV